ncbi:hypothetical protein ACFCVS_05535 [Bacillus altitudinis]|uniref:hypothetical protein n=1 Tax=Bacillus altitudinis TaxID=293387 RepID=UPI0035D7DF8D
MNLDDMEGFGGDIPFENFTDDIIPLLNLSDSDSYLMLDVCKADLGLKNESTKWIHFSRVNLTTDEKRKQFLKEISQNI